MISLVMIVKNEAEVLPRSLPTVRDFIDSWVILDTGSTDDTAEIIFDQLDGIPGELHYTKWTDYGTARNQLLELARGAEVPSEWMLTIDADMEVEVHEDLVEWLRPDPDPAVDGWETLIVEGNTKWRRPCLIRTAFPWEYVGPVHEYLNTGDAGLRQLDGLTLHHFGHATTPEGKWEGYLELLHPRVEQGDPRAVFYIAETLRVMGRYDEAIGWYERRAGMGSWEEEAWYAAYFAARLRKDVDGLLAAHARRPWRAEPLRWAARFVAENGHGGDILFIEQE